VTVRARLFLALLALALVPTAVFTIFTLVQLDRSMSHWFRPGVDHALESALQVSRTALTRLEATVLAQADDWGEALPAQPLNNNHRAAVRAGLRAAGLDFVQLYRREQGRWRRIEQVVPEGVIEARGVDLGGELDAALAASRVLHSPHGALAAVARMPDDYALVAGMWVPPDFFADIDRVSEGRGLYSRLGVMVDVQRPYTWLLVGLLVVVLVALALALATPLARQMSQPLSEMSLALEQVAGGDLNVRVRPHGARELRQLASSFNAMTERLETARDAVKQAEREAAWREVARRLAHEIKNPLTAMRYALHRVQRRAELVPDAERAAVQESLDAILQELQSLAAMADHFAQYARMPEPHMEAVDLGEVARGVAALHEPEAVRLSLDPEPVRVRADRLLLSRALQNLVLNAAEATTNGEPVVIRTRHDGGTAALEVLDRGAGLPEHLRDRLFDPYISTKNRGSGLGLSLVRDVARQHGGRVTIDNRVGGGVCARLELPLVVEDGREAVSG
jgi:nitrogen fixation/metabolism regulation signal transduction histidine kinase